jgi:NAD+ synthetase
MNIVVAQLNYIVGDFAGNTAKIIEVIDQHSQSADLIVFSELCISGYYPKDLLHRSGFIEAQNNALESIMQKTEGLKAAIVLGYARKNPFGGKPFLNSLSLIENGQILFTYDKQLLPTYGVFDEARHFEPGTTPGTFVWRGKRLGFLVCEDAWENNAQPLYKRDPVALFETSELDLIVSINASPYNIYKHQTRRELVANIANRCNAPMVYVNQVGGMDELVFDGNSLIYDEKGNCYFDGARFEESVEAINLNTANSLEIRQQDEYQMICDQLVTGLRDYCKKTGFKKVVIGSSGGIDSAVTIALAVLALGSSNVIAVTMPSKYSSTGSVDDSQDLCDALKVELIHAPIKSTFDAEVTAYTEAFGEAPSGLAQENLQARIRGQRLMTYSNSSGAMVVSTGNKTEMSVGYCTLYGDMAGGVSLLADLYKLQVYNLARYLNKSVFGIEAIPQAIIDKEPSAELAPDQLDSDALPPYDQLDAYLHLLVERDLLTDMEINAHTETTKKMSNEDKDKVKRLLDRNEYKRRQAAPVIRINRRSFGADRQIPLTTKFTT